MTSFENSHSPKPEVGPSVDSDPSVHANRGYQGYRDYERQPGFRGRNGGFSRGPRRGAFSNDRNRGDNNGQILPRVTSIARQTGNDTSDINNPRHDSLLDRLVGASNEAEATYLWYCDYALIDSGSMVTCMSEHFYRQIAAQYELHSIQDFELHVHGAEGSPLPFTGVCRSRNQFAMFRYFLC